MAIFKCDACGYDREVPEKLLGKKAKCPDCGHGVTISAGLAEEVQALADQFKEDDPVADIGDTGGEHEANSIELDKQEVTIELGRQEDILCSECGAIVPSGVLDGRCPSCGNEIKELNDLSALDEGLDVSDLAENGSAPVWDSDFDEQDVAAIEAPSKKASSFFIGSTALNIFAGIVSGVLGFFFALSMSLLASSQAGMYEFLPQVLSTALIAMTVGCFFYSLQSRIPFALAGPGTVLTAITFFFLGSIYRDMAGGYSSEAIMVTILASIMLTSVIAGTGLWIIGRLQAGELVRYVPIQIIGGVIGGAGIYVIIGAFDWMGQLSLDWSNIFYALKNCVFQLNAAQCMSSMGPSVVFGLILFLGLVRSKNSFFLLTLLIMASAVGYGAGLWGTDDIMKSLALPLRSMVDGVPQYPLEVMYAGLGDIQWGIIRDNGIHIGALGCLIALTSMYRITKLELMSGRNTDLSKEYRALGVTNMISGLFGGMPTAISFGRSAGSYASGGRGPIAGIVAGLTCAAGLFFVDELLPLIPRYVPEGLLLFSGLALIRGWMFKSRTAFTRRDDLKLLWITFFITVCFGLIIGIGFGVALALMMTVRRNSLGGAVRNVLSGSTYRSNVDRAPAQQRVLKEYGDHIHILRLHGFLFLGSMSRIIEEIQERLEDRNLLPVEYIILDFKMVSGLASASGIGFDKLRYLVEEYGIELIISSAPLELEEHLDKSGHLGEEDGAFKVFFDLDYAMEWCENRVLDAENILHLKQMTLPELLAPIFPNSQYVPALMKVLKRVVVKKGETVFSQGESSNSMYFVESGRLDVLLEMEDSKTIRLKKIAPGGVFGEMGIYTLAPRSATVVAAEKCVLYLMTTEKLNAIEKRAPILLSTVHRFMINLLAERLADSNTKVRELMN